MIRFLILIFFVYIAYRLVRRYLGTGQKNEPLGEAGSVDDMVKDPFCKTYVPRRTAYRRIVAGKEHFFCSEACADLFEREGEGEGD